MIRILSRPFGYAVNGRIGESATKSDCKWLDGKSCDHQETRKIKFDELGKIELINNRKCQH